MDPPDRPLLIDPSGTLLGLRPDWDHEIIEGLENPEVVLRKEECLDMMARSDDLLAEDFVVLVSSSRYCSMLVYSAINASTPM